MPLSFTTNVKGVVPGRCWHLILRLLYFKLTLAKEIYFKLYDSENKSGKI